MTAHAQSDPLLSVALVVRNAATTLPETIKSIQPIADQIVVLDTGSTDETPETAIGLDAEIVQRPWDDDFAAARNACLSHLRGRWVLWLDAGERVPEDHGRRLRSMLKEKGAADQAYRMFVWVPQGGGAISAEQVAQIRLMPNHPSLRFVGRVREDVLASLTELNIEVESLAERIERTEREHDQQIKLQRARRNLRLADLQIRQHGPSARMFNCVGEALHRLGEAEQAAEMFSQAVAHGRGGSADQLEGFYGLLTTLDSPPRRELQITTCLKGLETFPLDAQLLCAMGGYLQAQGQLDLAVRAYQTAFEHGQVNPEVWHLDEIHDITAACCALALQLQSKDAEALQTLNRAWERLPASGRIARHLLQLHARYGRRDEAMAVVDRMDVPPGQREAFTAAVRGACLAAQRNWIAAKAYLQTAYAAGLDDPFCLRWLSVVLLSLGDAAAAEPVLQHWERTDPGNAEVQQYLAALDDAGPSASVADESARRVRVDAPAAGQPPRPSETVDAPQRDAQITPEP